VHVEGNRHQLATDRLDEQVALVIGAVFQQLLRQVVAECVCKRSRID
jgi:hypothetical protein